MKEKEVVEENELDHATILEEEEYSWYYECSDNGAR